jgi:hypothetical protein
MDRIRNKLRSIFEASQEVNPAWKKINKSMVDLQKEFPNSDLVKVIILYSLQLCVKKLFQLSTLANKLFYQLP